MNWNKTIAPVALAVAAALPSTAALADGYRHHGHHGHGGHFGFYIGAPIWGPSYYPYEPAYAYYPPTRVITVPAAPTVYVERAAPPVYVERDAYSAAPSGQSDWWYYCGSSRSYYPYVRECRDGWQRVAPLPPSP